jgi:hypothetical protein
MVGVVVAGAPPLFEVVAATYQWLGLRGIWSQKLGFRVNAGLVVGLPSAIVVVVAEALDVSCTVDPERSVDAHDTTPIGANQTASPIDYSGDGDCSNGSDQAAQTTRHGKFKTGSWTEY